MINEAIARAQAILDGLIQKSASVIDSVDNTWKILLDITGNFGSQQTAGFQKDLANSIQSVVKGLEEQKGSWKAIQDDLKSTRYNCSSNDKLTLEKRTAAGQQSGWCDLSVGSECGSSASAKSTQFNQSGCTDLWYKQKSSIHSA